MRPPGRQPGYDFVQQIARPLAVFRGNLHDRLESQLVELHRAAARTAVVHLVHRQDDGRLHTAEAGGNFLVAWDETFPAVDDEDDNLSRRDSPFPVFVHQPMQRILACAEHSARVDEREAHVLPFRRLSIHVARRSGNGRDDRAARSGDAVEECGFPDVRAADENYRRPGGLAFQSHTER